MNKYNVPCPFKRVLEENATIALRSCEHEFDPFFCATSTENEKVRSCSRGYLPTSTDSWCSFDNNYPEKHTGIMDDFFQALHVNTTDKEPNGEVAGWKTCRYPHRSDLSNDLLERLLGEPLEKSAARTCSRAASPQKSATSSHGDKAGKLGKTSRTSSALTQRPPNSPISSIGRSPESEACIREMLHDKEVTQNDLQSAPPTAGGYFSKAEVYPAQHTSGMMKVKKPKVCRTYSTGYKPKLHQFRHLLGRDTEVEPFMHNMSGSYYANLYRNAKNERRNTSKRVMQSAVKTKLVHRVSAKTAYAEISPHKYKTSAENPVHVNNLKFQDPKGRQGMALVYYDDTDYYDIEDYQDVDNESARKASPNVENVRTKQDNCLDQWMNRKGKASHNLYMTGSMRTRDMPTGLHRANLPKSERKDTAKKKSSSAQNKSVRGVPPTFRPCSSPDSNKNGSIMTGTGGSLVSRTRPSIPSNAQGFACPAEVVSPAYYVSKPNNALMKKKQMLKAESFNNFLGGRRQKQTY